MIKFALRGLLGRKLRASLTAFAIVLGVALVAGTFVLTDSIDKAFDTIFTEARAGSSVVVTGKSAFDVGDRSGSFAPTLDASLLPRLRALPGVVEAEGGVNGEALLVDKKGKAIVFGGAPDLGFSIANGDSRFNPLTLVRGRWPRTNEVVIDKSTAGKKHFDVGDMIGVQAEGPVQKFRISGIVKFGSLATIGGATLAGFDLPTAQRIFNKRGQLDEVAIAAASGTSDAQLLKRVRDVLPPTAQARLGTNQAKEDASETNSFISRLQQFLVAFGGIALFVGSFVIANSLSITIAQRAREFATLRTIGASRRQVLVSVVLEALVIGVFASVAGLLVGIGLAKGLFSLFNAVGFTLPNSGLLVETRTIVVALVAGIVVTLVASLRPALRATRVPPIAAVREGAVLPPSRFARFRTSGSTLITVLGFASLAWGLFGRGLGTAAVLIWMGLGTLLVFFGVAILAVRFVEPMVKVVGWPALRIGGAAGRLAHENSRRNPQRTASTAAALMIGLALVTLVAVLAAGITSTFRDAVDEIWGNADYAVNAQNNFTPVPVSVADAVAKAPGVEAVGNVRAGQARVFGKTIFASGIDPPARTMFNLTWKEGSQEVLSTLGADGAFVDDGYAKTHHLTLGSPIEITFASGKKKRFVTRGIFDLPPGGSPFGKVTISAAAWDRFNENPRNLFSFVRVRGGETDANIKALERTLKAFPNAKVQTRKDFVDNQISFLNRILTVLYVLLALSVIVSLFGIVNTLVLTVFERTREIGMLRAVGMTRRQIRRMIRHESVITALIGVALGIALGIALGALLVARVDFIDFTLPVASLVVFGIVGIIVGLIAAIFPARRAARLNVLQALQYE